jgi:hypothetical protein
MRNTHRVPSPHDLASARRAPSPGAAAARRPRPAASRQTRWTDRRRARPPARRAQRSQRAATSPDLAHTDGLAVLARYIPPRASPSVAPSPRPHHTRRAADAPVAHRHKIPPQPSCAPRRSDTRIRLPPPRTTTGAAGPSTPHSAPTRHGVSRLPAIFRKPRPPSAKWRWQLDGHGPVAVVSKTLVYCLVLAKFSDPSHPLQIRGGSWMATDQWPFDPGIQTPAINRSLKRQRRRRVFLGSTRIGHWSLPPPAAPADQPGRGSRMRAKLQNTNMRFWNAGNILRPLPPPANPRWQLDGH